MGKGKLTCKAWGNQNNYIYYSTIVPFYHIEAKEGSKYAMFYTVEQGKIRTEEEQENGSIKQTKLCLVYMQSSKI